MNVDASLRTTVDHVWAIGDVASTPLQLAHVAFTEGYAVAERIAGHDVAEIDYVNIPKVTLRREIASVGLTEAQAREAGFDVTIEKVDFGRSARRTCSARDSSRSWARPTVRSAACT